MTRDSPTPPGALGAETRGGLARSIIGWLAALAVVGGQAWLRYDSKSFAPTATFLAGALLLALVLRQRHDSDWAPATAAVPRRRGVLAAQALSVLAIAAASAALLLSWNAAFYPGWSLMLAATAAYSFALSRSAPPKPPRSPWPRYEIVALVLIFSLGAWLRLHRFGEFPDGFTTHAIEEQQTGLGGFRVLNGGRPWEFFLDYQLTALAEWIDPQSDFTTIRAPYVVVSILTIIPVHLLFRQLLGVPAALAGTFLYSASSWNLLYSRCAHPIFPTNILVIIVLALLVHFDRTRRLTGMPWVGLLCGYTLYSYAGFRGTPLFAAVFLGGALWRTLWHRRGRRQLTAVAAGCGVFAITLLAAAAPLYRLLDRGPHSYYFEAAQRSLANREYYTDDRAVFLQQRLLRIRDTAAIFMHFGDGSLTFNDPTAPMLDPVTAALATLGLLLMLLRPRQRHNLFFLFVPLLLMLVGTVFVQNLDVRRLGGLTVFVALAAGHSVDALWGLVARRSPAVRAVALTLALAAGFAAVGWSYRLYFVRMGESPEVRRAFKDHYTTLIHYGRVHGAGRSTLLLSYIRRFFDSGYHYRANYSWLIDPVLKGHSLRDVNELLLRKGLPPSARPRSVVAQRPFEVEIIADLVQQAFPGALCQDYSEPDNPWVGLIGCDLPEPAGPANVEMSLTARYWAKKEGQERPALERREPFLGYATVPPICYSPGPKPPCHAEWRGTIEVGSDADYQLMVEAQGRTPFQVRLDGQVVNRFPHPLAAGSHIIEISADLWRDWETGVRLSWIKNGKAEVIPFYRRAAP